jgi:hypothetical protein
MQDRPIVAYTVVDSMYASSMATRVQEMITQGWQPYGSPFETGSYVAQAMVKYKPITVANTGPR